MRVDRVTRGCRALEFLRRPRLVVTFAVLAATITCALAGTAIRCAFAGTAIASSGGAGSGPSGGSGIRPKAHPKPKHRAKHRVRHDRVAAASNALASRGMWIWVLSSSDGGNLSSLVAGARRYGISTVMIKSGDGTNVWSQFTSGLVSALHRRGLRVCAWQYVYGDHPITEAYVGAAAVHDGADCLIIDAEAQYEGKYVSAQAYVTRLRKLIGGSYPVALAGFPYVDYHPGFPYSVFLGPGGAQFNTPQMYWAEIGTTVDAVYAHTYAFNRLYRRALDPMGQAFNHPRAGQIKRFRQMSRSYGAANVSWWNWQSATTGDWIALSQPIGALHRFTPSRSYATLGVHAQGDVVVWAQEHLVAAGERVAIDGSFGPLTLRAVEKFQRGHGLPVDGLIGQNTWSALLRYSPVHVRWVHRGRRIVASLASGNWRELPVPKSARLPAKRDEIPGSGGAGWPKH
jgi:peptidoglycan hydrolase-like protein with peptidoglycan-binding domain